MPSINGRSAKPRRFGPGLGRRRSTDLAKLAQHADIVGWLPFKILRPQRAGDLADIDVAVRVDRQPMRTDIVADPGADVQTPDPGQQIAFVVDDRQPCPQVWIVTVGARRRPQFADVTDRARTVRHEHPAWPVQVVELRLVAAISVEHLDAMVFPVGHINPTIRIAGYVGYQVE